MSESDISSLVDKAFFSRAPGKSRLEHPAATWAISRLTNEQPDPARSSTCCTFQEYPGAGQLQMARRYMKTGFFFPQSLLDSVTSFLWGTIYLDLTHCSKGF